MTFVSASFVGYAFFTEGEDLNMPLFLESIGKEGYRPGNSAALHEQRDSMARYDSLRIAQIEYQEKQINYYMRTHNVAEKGFDIIARYDVAIKAERDSLLHADSVYSDITSKETLQWLITNNPSSLIFNPSSLEAIINYSLFITHYSLKKLPQGRAGEGLWYIGDTDPFGVPSGFGVDFTPGIRMRVGEWRDGKYLGERITYTSERIYGIDISRYQHEKGRKRFGIDWKNLAITSLGTISKKKIEGAVDYPISFIYIKSSEGTTVRNRYFAADYANARKYGYKTGAYHFFSTKTSGAMQAKFFCKVAKYNYGDFPPVLDIEPSHAQIAAMGGALKMFKEIRAWLHHVELTWHVKPVLYISQNFVNRYLPLAPDLMKSYDVWIARYGEYKPDVNLVYWQLCPDGRVRGIKTEVDINVFNGFKKEFEEY